MEKIDSLTSISRVFWDFFSDFSDSSRREELLKRAKAGNLLFLFAAITIWLTCLFIYGAGQLRSLEPVHWLATLLLVSTLGFQYILHTRPAYFIPAGFVTRALHYVGIIGFVYITGGMDSPFLFIPVVHAFTDMFVVHLFYGIFSLVLGFVMTGFLLLLEGSGILPFMTLFVEYPGGMTIPHHNTTYGLLRYSVLVVTLLLGAGGIIYASAKIRLQENELKAAYEKLKDYYHNLNLLEIQRERELIAQELHDNLGNDLTHIKLMSELALTMKEKSPEKSHQLMENIRDCTRENIETLRTFLWVIYPQENTWENFFHYLQAIVERQLHPYGIKLVYDLQEEVLPAPRDAHLRFKLLRIVKEAVSNVIKHAKANEVSISIRQESNDLFLSIRDNGIGFDPQQNQKGYGVRFMAKRIEELGGRFRIDSGEKRGTELTVHLPLRESF